MTRVTDTGTATRVRARTSATKVDKPAAPRGRCRADTAITPPRPLGTAAELDDSIPEPAADDNFTVPVPAPLRLPDASVDLPPGPVAARLPPSDLGRPATDNIEVPHERFGSYEVFECLGRGGMASVHRAELAGVAGFRRAVALKRMHPHVADDPSLVKSFVQEAQLAADLKHQNIAHAYHLGKCDGTYFIAMELVQGPTLLQIMAQCSLAAGPIPIEIAVAILIQVCDALDYAHTLCDDQGRPRGIIHRDVSPTNVVVSNSGVVKLIDFGIAKARSRMQTREGMIKGKIAYVAPEYLQGSLDARADLFGLGVIAHELLTSRRLFRGPTEYETMENIRTMAVKPPSHWNPAVPSDLDNIVMTALERDPEQRWQNAAALRTALTLVAKDLGIVVCPRQIVDWVMWAFSQQPRENSSEISRVIAELEPSISIDIGPFESSAHSRPTQPAATELNPYEFMLDDDDKARTLPR
ncbi:MAG: serine/threonine-protein kinase [Kofleriaceae bacterium]